MFDLNEAIENWKRSFRGKCSAEDLEELVTHLLDLFENLKASGLDGFGLIFGKGNCAMSPCIALEHSGNGGLPSAW